MTENMKSQILNSGKINSIEEVYSKIEAKEQRLFIMIGVMPEAKHMDRSAFLSKGNLNQGRSFKRCTHCKKNGHAIDFYWDLHPKKKNIRNKDDHKKNLNGGGSMTDERRMKIAEQITSLQTCLGHVPYEDSKDMLEVNQTFAAQGDKGKNPTTLIVVLLTT